MDALINPHKLKGEIDVIASKSITHRALICAALANGTSVVKNALHSNDTFATIDMLNALGVDFEVKKDTIVYGRPMMKPMKVLNANESGSSIRFLIPVAITSPYEVIFDGKEGLRKRPQNVYFDLFKKHQITYEALSNEDLPFKVKGPLTPGTYELPGDISSQFITGLLFSLPLLNGDSLIKLTTPLESVGYIDLTLDVLRTYGISIEVKGNTYHIKGNQSYEAKNYEVEGDFSQAAFFLVANTLGSKVVLNKMNEKSLQGDKKIIEIINQMGGSVYFENGQLFAKKAQTKGIEIDLSQTPDLGPILTVLASVSKGTTTIVNAQRLRIKESDRIKSMICELTKMGAKITETSDGMIIQGVSKLKGNVTLEAWNDHRVVMALSIAATIADGPVRIKNSEAVNKSYPTFFEEFARLQGSVTFE